MAMALALHLWYRNSKVAWINTSNKKSLKVMITTNKTIRLYARKS